MTKISFFVKRSQPDLKSADVQKKKVLILLLKSQQCYTVTYVTIILSYAYLYDTLKVRRSSHILHRVLFQYMSKLRLYKTALILSQIYSFDLRYFGRLHRRRNVG